MNSLMLNFVEINLVFIILYSVYQLIKSHISFYLRRLILLVLPVLSVITIFANQLLVSQSAIMPTIRLDVITVSKNAYENTQNIDYLMLIYLAGAGVFAFWSFVKVVKVLNFIKKSNFNQQNKYKIATSNQKDSFSFFNFIHLSAHLSNEEKNIVLEHELIHCEEKHSFDIILMEIYHSFFWVNPLLFIIKKELIHVHEFEVDQQMYGKHKVEYIKHLLSYALGSKTSQLILTSQFYNDISLTKRTKIMTNKIKNKKSLLVILPLSVVLLSLVSWTGLKNTQGVVFNQSEQQDEKVYDEVDKMPEFNGGMAGLSQYLGENIKYPKKSAKEGVEGKVNIQFVIDKTGAVKDVVVLKGVTEEIDREAIRVVESMPSWTPGEKDGKKVSVKMVIPIKFELAD